MDASQVYRTNYMQTTDVPPDGMKLTVADCNEFETQEGRRRLAMHFVETELTLVLNNTRATTMIDAYGPETDSWKGKRIKLRLGRTNYKGKMVDTIRIELPPNQPAPAAQQTPPPQRPAPTPKAEDPWSEDDVEW